MFKKKNHQRSGPSEAAAEENQFNQMKANDISRLEQKHPLQLPCDFSFDNSLHLPPLLSSEPVNTNFTSSTSFNLSDIECSQNLMKIAAGDGVALQYEKLNADWSILEKLLASHQNLDQIFQGRSNPGHNLGVDIGCSIQRFPLPYLG